MEEGALVPFLNGQYSLVSFFFLFFYSRCPPSSCQPFVKLVRATRCPGVGVLSVGIRCSMSNLVCDSINYCASSFDISKINVYRPMINYRPEKTKTFYMVFDLKDGYRLNVIACRQLRQTDHEGALTALLYIPMSQLVTYSRKIIES